MAKQNSTASTDRNNARLAFKKRVNQDVKRLTPNAKTVTTGKIKAINKVQKGLDATINRVPGIKAHATSSRDGKVKVSENGITVTSKGSNKAAAKGNTPKNTPGVKKNTSRQRSINNSNKELKTFPRRSGGMRGGGLGGLNKANR